MTFVLIGVAVIVYTGIGNYVMKKTTTHLK
ncbi:hypothetical protein LYSBPC_00780 [Lysinibacillus piscis]|uniref:Fur-regulated basic protein FbpC n=1 Tax=Lysinibacillus piscis TaxID=2518931 RepID=A0ABQ5NEY1_9BACI|nr:hypothetical protein LYSBPC_00780 [Lysinibacillus sp. KH24]